MIDIPRFIAYASGLLVVALAAILFTNSFIIYVNEDGLIGTLALFGFGLVYMNLVFAISRRFIRKLTEPTNIQYYFAAIAFLPPAVWVNIYDTGLAEGVYIFLITLAFGCVVGGYFGNRSGLKQQVIFQQKLKEALEQHSTPEELQRPHDNLNKN